MSPDTLDLSALRTIPLLEAAELLGIGRTRAYEMVRADEFPVPVRKIGREWRVRVRDVEALFD